MKKLLGFSAFILCAGIAMGQSLQKDKVYTLHVMEVHLNPGVSMDQFLDVVNEDYIPALNEAFPDVSNIFLEGIRGKHENQFGVLILYDSEEVLKKYWPETGVASELNLERNKIVVPAREKMAKLADYDWVTWTSWKVK